MRRGSPRCKANNAGNHAVFYRNGGGVRRKLSSAQTSPQDLMQQVQKMQKSLLNFFFLIHR